MALAAVVTAPVIWGTELTVKTPGSLNELIAADEKYEVTELKLSGEINGTDMLFLREMAALTYDGTRTDGKLRSLDLSGARIVEGGESYAYNNFYGIDYFSVTDEVGTEWFAGSPTLEAFVCPVTATSIGGSAFMECGKLATVTIGENVKSIQANAFRATALTNVDIPDKVESIYSMAFSDCDSLKTINIGSGLSGIDSPFILTPALENIFVSDENTTFQDIDGVLTYDSGKVLMAYPSAHGDLYTIPESVQEIYTYAFLECKGLRDLIFGDNVRTVGLRAFEKAEIESVTFNNGLETIGDFAFIYSTVESVMLPESLKHLGESAFSGCTKMIALFLPSDIQEIGSGAFGSCYSLEELRIPDSFTSLSAHMFQGATGLKSLKLGSGLETIPEGCFSDAYSLEALDIPANIKSIGNSGFSNCMVLKTINFSEGLESIARDAFSSNSSLEELILPSTLKEVGGGAFSNCSGLEKIVIPDLIKVIDEYMFSYAMELKEVILGEGLETIGNGAFNGCMALESITWGKNIKTIGDFAFSYCEKMSLDNLPESLEQIGTYAFSGIDISSLVLPASVKKIGAGAFGGWYEQLTKVVCYAIEPPVCDDAPFGYSMDYSAATLQVPGESVEAYATADVWKEFGNIEEVKQDGIDGISTEMGGKYEVYTLSGVKVYSGDSYDELSALPSGIYIVNGKKTAIK